MGVPRYRLGEVRLTADGRREFEAELERLRAEMADIAGQVAQAREEGNDPSENLMLRDALDALALTQSRVADVETLLAAAEPADGAAGPGGTDALAIGRRVRVRHEDGEEASYTLVSPVEANPRMGRISIASPARPLI